MQNAVCILQSSCRCKVFFFWRWQRKKSSLMRARWYTYDMTQLLSFPFEPVRYSQNKSRFLARVLLFQSNIIICIPSRGGIWLQFSNQSTENITSANLFSIHSSRSFLFSPPLPFSLRHYDCNMTALNLLSLSLFHIPFSSFFFPLPAPTTISVVNFLMKLEMGWREKKFCWEKRTLERKKVGWRRKNLE